MSVIRRVDVPAGETVQVIPPDGVDRVAAYCWTIENPGAAAVDLVEDPSDSFGDGFTFAPGDPAIRLLERSEAVWAAAGAQEASLQVIGTAFA